MTRCAIRRYSSTIEAGQYGVTIDRDYDVGTRVNQELQMKIHPLLTLALLAFAVAGGSALYDFIGRAICLWPSERGQYGAPGFGRNFCWFFILYLEC